MFGLIPWKRRNQGGIRVRRGEPDYPLAGLREEFASLMERFFGDRTWSEWPSPALWDNLRRPGWDMDLADQGREYVLRAELPGFEPGDFDVKVSGNVLTVRAEHRSEKKESNCSSYRYGTFVRTLTLPYGVDAEKIGARYHSGVLEVQLPKSETAETQRIEVKTE